MIYIYIYIYTYTCIGEIIFLATDRLAPHSCERSPSCLGPGGGGPAASPAAIGYRGPAARPRNNNNDDNNNNEKYSSNTSNTYVYVCICI